MNYEPQTFKKFQNYSVLFNYLEQCGVGVHEQLRNIHFIEPPPTNKTAIYLLYT
jgi:hypothetical protein